MAMITAEQAWDRFATPIEKSIARFGPPDRAVVLRVLARAKRAGFAIKSSR